MPSPETLATLAATLVRNLKAPPRQAVEYAVELWQEAQNAVTLTARMYRDAEKRGLLTVAERVKREVGTIRFPRKFPASFDEFLPLIVPGKNTSVREGRFRGYAVARFGTNGEAEVTWRKREGFHTEEWRMEAWAFLLWWKSQTSATNSANASRPKTKSAEKSHPPQKNV